jgi:excisionase family DNA binding protein
LPNPCGLGSGSRGGKSFSGKLLEFLTQTGSQSAPRLLTVADVAERLQFSEKHVRRLIEAGEIPAVRIGRLVRVSEDDLTLFIRRNRT